jgi:carbon storage regulator
LRAGGIFLKHGRGAILLVLSRQKHEKVILELGSLKIVVMVSEIRGDKVRLGFEAPKEMVIHREEVYEAIRKEAGK